METYWFLSFDGRHPITNIKPNIQRLNINSLPEGSITEPSRRPRDILLHPVPQADLRGVPAQLGPWHHAHRLMPGGLCGALAQ